MAHSTWAEEVVVITGASAGVGRATAKRFAKAGARLGLIARDREALETLRDELAGKTAAVHVVAADVSDAEALFAAADEIANTLGPIDVWVNDAMVTVFSPIWEMTPEEFRAVTETTYLGQVHGTMAALKHMRPRNKGRIVQVGSSLAYRGIPLQSAYCGAKHAIRGFTDAVRAELLHDNSNVTITMVQLPAVNTPQFDWARTHLDHQPRPVAPVFEPEVPANAIFDAAHGMGREYWLDTSTAKIILGNMVMPSILDKLLAKKAIPGQERSTPVLPGRRDNLEHPVHDLHRTHGAFGQEARNSAPLFTADQVRLGVLGVGLAVAAAAIAGVAQAARHSR